MPERFKSFLKRALLWVVAIGATLLIPSHLRWKYLHGYDDEVFRFWRFVFDYQSIIDFITILALYITVVALWAARTQTEASRRETGTLNRIVEALGEQTKALRIEIETVTETKPLENTEAILSAFNAICAKGIGEIKEIYVAADTIAIGATGDDKSFLKYKSNIEDLAEQLKGKLHAAYTALTLEEVQDSAGNKHKVLAGSSVDALNTFYTEKNITDQGKLEKVMRYTGSLHNWLTALECAYKPISDPQNIVPHFILINPDEPSRHALIWNIDRHKSGEKHEVVATGFSTTNQQIGKSMMDIFQNLR